MVLVATPTCQRGTACHKSVFRAQSGEYALDCAHCVIKLNRADLRMRKRGRGCNKNYRSLNRLN